MNTYYCRVCGSMALVISTPLENLLRRKSDQAYIVECDTHFHKKTALSKANKVQVVRRDDKGGIEKHYNWNCKDCQFLIGYQCHDSGVPGQVVSAVNTDDLVVGPGARGKTLEALAEDREKRKHFYIRAI